jgi:hypothetical protein
MDDEENERPKYLVSEGEMRAFLMLAAVQGLAIYNACNEGAITCEKVGHAVLKEGVEKMISSWKERAQNG